MSTEEKGMLIDPNMGLSEHEHKKHIDELYGKAKIDRHESKGSAVARANRALEELAIFIQKESPEANILKTCDYVGSAAVHCYRSKVLQQTFFISQTDPMTSKAHEAVAGAAISDLRKQLMLGYGRKATKKRSGF